MFIQQIRTHVIFNIIRLYKLNSLIFKTTNKIVDVYYPGSNIYKLNEEKKNQEMNINNYNEEINKINKANEDFYT